MKTSIASIARARSSSPQASRNFTPAKASPTNRAGARIAAQRAKPRAADAAVAVAAAAATAVRNARCSRQRAASAAASPKFRFSRAATSRFTAAIVSRHAPATVKTMNDHVRALINGVGLSAIHIGALAAFVPGMFHWSGLVVLMVLMYATGALGVTLCYHRALTHRAFQLRKPLEYALAILGTLALQ